MLVSKGPDFTQDISEIRSKISGLSTSSSYNQQQDVDRALRDLKDALLGIVDVLAGLNEQLHPKKVA
jgi:hypothetical protein